MRNRASARRSRAVAACRRGRQLSSGSRSKVLPPFSCQSHHMHPHALAPYQRKRKGRKSERARLILRQWGWGWGCWRRRRQQQQQRWWWWWWLLILALVRVSVSDDEGARETAREQHCAWHWTHQLHPYPLTRTLTPGICLVLSSTPLPAEPVPLLCVGPWANLS